MDREAWWATVHGVKRVRHHCATEHAPVVETLVLSMPGPQAGSLVRRLKSHKLQAVAKKKKKKEKDLGQERVRTHIKGYDKKKTVRQLS